MIPFELDQILIALVATLFTLGLITFLLGLFVLVVRAFSKDMRTLTKQTARLAHKGIAEDVAGLVGNASMLVNALQGLARTAAGIGIFLTLMGAGLISAAYLILRQIDWPL